MSKKKSKNLGKNNQRKKQLNQQPIENNTDVNAEAIKNIPELNDEFKAVEIQSQKLKKSISSSTYDDLFIDMNEERNNKKASKKREIEKVNIDAEKENIDNETKKINIDDIKLEKSIECTALRVTERKGFFKLVFKLIGVYLASFGKAIMSKLNYLLIIIKNFFEDRAEDLDRKIKELQDEEIIKDKKRKLDYEEYSTKRIYKDLEKAEIYKNRASNRVNTEKYFDDKIEQEKVNNKILISEVEDLSKEKEQKAQNINKTANAYSSNKKSRIEKKRNEIIELRRKRKEERLKKEKEQKQAEMERKALEAERERIKAEEEKMISEAEDIIKSLESQIRDVNSEPTDDDYNNIFNDFGSENDLSSYGDELLNDDYEVKKPEEGKKEEIAPKKSDDILDEPYEKFEKENDIREIDDDLKSEILRLMDVPESDTKEEDPKLNVQEEDKQIDYTDSSLLISDIEDVKDEKSEEPAEEKKSYSIFDALKSAKKDNTKTEKKQEEKVEVEKIVDEAKEEKQDVKVRVSDNQDGFKVAKENIEKNKANSYYKDNQTVNSISKDLNNVNRAKADERLKNVNTIYDENKHDKLEVEDFPLGAALLGINQNVPSQEQIPNNAKKLNQEDKRKETLVKEKNAQSKKIIRSKKSRKNDINDFDEDMYTNRFMKNIIGMDEIESKENNRKQEVEIEDYNFNNPYDESNYTYEDYKKFFEEDIAPKTNNYSNLDKNNSIHEKNKYYEELLDQRYEESKRKEEYNNEPQYRIEHDNGNENIEEKTTFGSRLKDMASSINLIPNTLKKKRESKNRIKKNQIYSTSYYKKGKKR